MRSRIARTQRSVRSSSSLTSAAAWPFVPSNSLQRTSTGLAREPLRVYAPYRGPTRFRPAQLKHYAADVLQTPFRKQNGFYVG